MIEWILKLFGIKVCKCKPIENTNHCVVNDCTHDWGGR